jgi:hypothetical protein
VSDIGWTHDDRRGCWVYNTPLAKKECRISDTLLQWATRSDIAGIVTRWGVRASPIPLEAFPPSHVLPEDVWHR